MSNSALVNLLKNVADYSVRNKYQSIDKTQRESMGSISSKADTFQAIENSDDPIKKFCFEKCENKTVNAYVATYPANHRIYNCLCKDLESEARKWAITFGVIGAIFFIGKYLQYFIWLYIQQRKKKAKVEPEESGVFSTLISNTPKQE